MIYVLLDEFNTIHSYSIKISDNQVFSEEWILLDVNYDMDPDELIFKYKYVDGNLIELTETEKDKYLSVQEVTAQEITIEDIVREQESKILILQKENQELKESLNQIYASVTELMAMTLEQK